MNYKTDKEVILTFTEPLKSIPFNENEFQIIHIDSNNFQTRENLTENHLGTSHMNIEVMEQFVRLCKKISHFLQRKPIPNCHE